jgi:nucleoside-diphosphate-sugar epimerase
VTSSKPVVTITGISGFIGMYVVKEFIQDESFTVRGTMRGKTDDKILPLKEAFGEDFITSKLLKPTYLMQHLLNKRLLVRLLLCIQLHRSL